MDGYIKEIGISPVYGKYVIVDHENGYETFYAHLRTILWVDVTNQKTEGERVIKGQAIGIIGGTGISTGVHLHYEVRTTFNGELVTINPAPLLLM